MSPPLPPPGLCLWPIGPVFAPPRGWCCAEVEPGRPYCTAHRAQAFDLSRDALLPPAPRLTADEQRRLQAGNRIAAMLGTYALAKAHRDADARRSAARLVAEAVPAASHAANQEGQPAQCLPRARLSDDERRTRQREAVAAWRERNPRQPNPRQVLSEQQRIERRRERQRVYDATKRKRPAVAAVDAEE